WIKSDAKVTALQATADHITEYGARGHSLECENLVFSLPPQLVTHIEIPPELPTALTTVLPTVQTWMAGSIKFALEYDRPFWREGGYSGMLFSHAGIVTEMYDHTNFEENKFGVTGFLIGGAVNYFYDLRKELV